MISHKKLQEWVKEVAALCQPDGIHWCDGSQQEYDALIQQKQAKQTQLQATLDEALALHAEASSIRKEILGMHKDTAFSLGNYGAALAGNEQWQEAASVLMDAIVMYSQLDMDESPYARACRENLDVCRRATMKPC